MKTTLFDLQSGEEAKITMLNGGDKFRKKLTSLNIMVGKIIRKITAEPFRGPVVIEIGNTKVTIGTEMAKKIVVEPLKAH